MEQSDSSLRELLSILKGIRWHLAGLEMEGVRDWVIRSETPAPERAEVSASDREQLSAIAEDLRDCRRCPLQTSRTNIVFGEGNPHARLLFVGEGPGFDEDRQGRPFVGRAGKLLDKMIRAMGMERKEVYICNVVKCRPPNNRTPEQEEVRACSPFLFRQMAAVGPTVICALGLCAAQALFGATSSISALRGKTLHWNGIPVVATYHPAYLLRNPAQKAASWQDLLRILEILDKPAELRPC